MFVTSCQFQLRSNHRTERQASRQPSSWSVLRMNSIRRHISYCENNGAGEADGRANNFAVARVLVGTFAAVRTWNRSRIDALNIPHWKQTKGIGRQSIVKSKLVSREMAS